MAVLEMQKICICALKKERKPIIEYIQRSGVVEIKERKVKKGFSKMDTSVAKSSFERNAALAENALEVLEQYAPEKKSMFSSLEGKRQVASNEFKRISDNRDEIMDKISVIINLQKEISAKQNDILKLKANIEAVKPWLNMDVPGATTGTEKTAFIYGSFPGNITQEQLYQQIQSNEKFPKASDVRIFYSDKNQTCVAGFCMKKDEKQFEEALRQMDFSRPSLIMRSIPEVSKEKWTKRIAEFENSIDNRIEELRQLAEDREDIQLAADYFNSRAEKYDVLGRILQTKHVFIITGYIPKKEFEKLKETLTDKFTVMIEAEEISAKEQPPVLLENNAFARPVEGVVESFGLPKKGEFDPSTIMAVFYYILFGMMLSDAAYGLIIFLACFIAIKKFPRMGDSLNKSLHMFMYCGISTTIWGVLFGGFFGDAITVVSNVFFHKNIELKALWFVPLNDPMRLLMYSMVIGIIHMFLGLGIKGYMLLKDNKIVDFICDVLLWYSLLIGLILLLLPTDLFASISQMTFVFPVWLTILSKALTIIGLVGLLLMSGRRKGNKWAIRIALGAYDIYNVTGWLSDLLSYSRLLALGLATGVIASVVNSMGSMIGDGPVGIIVFIIVFIVGHTLNLAINLLGAYVHTNRLQYVEFFGKFYEGGGRAFNPFTLKTKYVKLDKGEK